MLRPIIAGAVVGIVGLLALVPTSFVSANNNGDKSHDDRTNHTEYKKDKKPKKKLATVVGDDGQVIGGKGAGGIAPSSSTVSPSDASTSKYVALGDSVAAGLGLQRADDGDEACGLSSMAYGARVAASLQLSYTNLACSGATAGDLVTEQHLPDTSRDIEPQLDHAFANGIPQLMTITAGANDIQWSNFIRKCYAATCGTTTDKAAAKVLIAAMRLKLDYALNSIEERSDSGKTPQVVVTGYYKPFAKSCAKQQSRLMSKEISWLNDQTNALNQAITKAVAKHPKFARYAPVSFSGHELCTSTPWIQGLNDAAPFHPNETGQSKIAQVVLRKIKKDDL